MPLIKELKRRNVFKVGVAYMIIAWLLLQVSDTLVPALHLPNWFHSAVALVLILGFPLALFFAWAFELTPEGLRKEKDVEPNESITHVTSRKIDFVIIAMLIVALGYFGYDKYIVDPRQDALEVKAAVQAAREEKASSDQSQISAQSIAVLPFLNMSEDPNNEYFADGISEEILNLLVKIRGLQVTSRSSAFSFKGQNVDVPTIAARLNVTHVLEGSVRKFGNQVRITAQLIEVDTDTHLWSETYDREFKSVFAMQDEIAAAVVVALKITLLGEAPKATETSPEAYALYLQARHSIDQYTVESNLQAEALLEQALEIDPNFAPAWMELGSVYERQSSTFGSRPTDEGNELARHAIQQALTIDPNYGRAYSILAGIEMRYDWDFTAADQHMQKALALNPGDAAILESAANLEDLLGRIDNAISLHRQSLALDPVSSQGHYALGRTYWKAHRLKEAADSLALALSLKPGRVRVQFYAGLVLLAQGAAPAALVAMEQVTTDFWRHFGTAIVQSALGNIAASDAALKEIIDQYPTHAAYQIASVYAFRGEIDLAFDWLDLAYDTRDSGLTNLLLDPLLTKLHDDPRWEPLLDKMGLPH